MMHRSAVSLLIVEGTSLSALSVLSALNESIPGPLHGLLDMMIDIISMMTTTTTMMMMIIMMMMLHVWPIALGTHLYYTSLLPFL